MSNLQEITDAIDGRLAELKQQIASLEAARRALTDIRRSPADGGADSRPATAPRKPTKPRRSRASTPSRSEAEASASAGPSAPPTSNGAGHAAEITPPAKPARRRRPSAPAATAPARSRAAQPATAPAPAAAAKKARPTKSSPKGRRRELEPGQIEDLLRNSEDGLSLVALTRRAGVSEAKVAERLTTLERSGEARRSGPRRTSLWRLVTDEERIAERAAELARASKPKS
jgi:hypothetical protein